MQLKKPKSIRNALANATCVLLGTGLTPPVMAEVPLSNWDFDSAILYYSEQDRVTALEPVISARKDLGDNEFMNLRFVADVLSGASPNGALPYKEAQTFSGPSGKNSYRVNPNETPLDPTFKDLRFAANLEWEKPRSRELTTFLGVSLSVEQDYTALGLFTTANYDLNKKNTTLSIGASISLDKIAPIGGAPEPLTALTATSGETEGEDEEDEGEDGPSKSKTVTDFLFGVTQIINRQTLTQINYSIGKSDGYLTDPYKILSVVDAAGLLLPPTTVGNTETLPYLHEKRPASRARESLYWKINHQFTDDVLYLTYRYYWDDWNITSHTIDLRYRFQIGNHHFLQPHARHYRQTAADFFQYFVINGNTPEYASADYRLGEMTTNTYGILYGVELDRHSEFNFRVESIRQSGESHPSNAPLELRNYDLFPDVNAIVMQASYSYKF